MKHILIGSAIALCSFMMNTSTAQTAAHDNKVSKSITFRAIPKGPSIFGIFQGRPPCAGITEQLKVFATADCVKLKWNLVLYRDSVTLQPTTYALTFSGAGEMINENGNTYRNTQLNGKWAIVKGIPSNPAAEVFQLEMSKPATHIYLLKGDDNVLFLLDEHKGFRIGNEDFSYTLNRVELVPAK